MKTLGIIPARYASTRFPGKQLVDIAGKSMIQRVYEQAKKCALLTDVVVATDDGRIYNHVLGFGGKAVMTSSTHQSGTDRCAEVAGKHPDFPIIVNIQGDEPYIDPEQINKLISCFNAPDTQIATLVKKVQNNEELFTPNSPKVILNKHSEAIYFSRSPLPHIRGKEETDWLNHFTFYKHIGIYGYRADILHQVTKLPVSSLEKAVCLVLLCWFVFGFRFFVVVFVLVFFVF